ncbi:DUF4352 domain-containing protein [Streptomyces sp. NPDC058667]|uniref:DUF4352 domain-containing protein n=1 Tax=Streptomyces sp. NPDC058667 TaxID=3346588 RepID=UPI00365E59F2
MRRTAIAATTAALCLTLAACNGTEPEVNTKPNPQPSKTAAEKAPETTKAPAPKDAAIGDTLTLKGLEDGQQIDVTLTKTSDPAVPKDEFFRPEDGNRWIGVQVQIVNTGTVVYDDSPGNGMKVADSEGQWFNGVIADIKAGPSMAAGVALKPGAKALGWAVFEVPKKSKIATVQFGMNSGFSDQTGEWKLN